MGNVTLNIQGNAGGGGGAMPPAPSSPSSPGVSPSYTPTSPSAPSSPAAPSPGSTSSPSPQAIDLRMMEDVRRAIIQQGAIFVPGNNTYKPIIQQAEQIQRDNLNREITRRYGERRDDLIKNQYESIDRSIDEGKLNALSGITDPDKRKKIEEYWENKREAEFQRAGSSSELDQLDKEEEQERKKSNDELSRVIQDLTEEIKRNGGNLNPNSFLSQLRQERQKAIVERDTAEDEETSRAAAQRVKEIDQRINNVVNGKKEDEEPKTDYGLRAIQTMMGFDQIVRGIVNKDMGSMIMGGGQAMTSMLGMGDKAAARSLAFLKPLATVGTLLTQEGQKSDQMAGLAALIRGDRSIEDTRQSMYPKMLDYSPYNKGLASIYDMGLSVPEFAQSSERRIKQRGIAQGGVEESYFQEALERVFSLNSGALGEAGKFDRYGINSTDAISNLVERLTRVQNSGVSQNNYARVQEYLGMQQDLMNNYMRFSNNPSYAIANKDLEAFSNLKNYTVDSRTTGDIKSVQNQLTNPQNDRMKAVLYSTVEDMYSETRGRADLIDQYLNDPKKMGAISRSYMQKLTSMYGGYDTPMGYFMIKSQLPGIERPDGRKSIWEGLTSGKAGDIFASSSDFRGSNKESYALDVKNYNTEVTKFLIKVSDNIYNQTSKVEKIISDMEKVVTGQQSFFDYIKSKLF